MQAIDQKPPVLTPYTRLAVMMSPARAILRVAGYTRRYTFKNSIDVINIGLRLDDILDMEGVDVDALAEPCNVEGDKRRDE